MEKITYKSLLPIYSVVIVAFLLLAIGGSNAVTAWSATAPITGRKTVVIDAGHGGIDGGATSYTGVLESQINLEIALKLNDLMHLLGIQTYMIRETDRSVYTQGETISQKKISPFSVWHRYFGTRPESITSLSKPLSSPCKLPVSRSRVAK